MPDILDYNNYLLFPALVSVIPSGVAVEFIDVPDANFEAFSFEEALGRAETELYKTIHSKRVITRREGKYSKIVKPTSFERAVKMATNESCYLHMVAISEEAVLTYAKKTVSLPMWLNKLADEANLNLSAILSKGVANELGLTKLELAEVRKKSQ